MAPRGIKNHLHDTYTPRQTLENNCFFENEIVQPKVLHLGNHIKQEFEERQIVQRKTSHLGSLIKQEFEEKKIGQHKSLHLGNQIKREFERSHSRSYSLQQNKKMKTKKKEASEFQKMINKQKEMEIVRKKYWFYTKYYFTVNLLASKK